MKRSNLFLALFCLLATLGSIAAAWAAITPGAVKFSTAEDVVIAFYKTGGAVPPYEKWITAREPYRTTPLTRRPDFMAEEKARLKSLYAAFDPHKNFITLKTRVVARVVQHQDKDNPDLIHTVLDMRFEAGDAYFFPYDFIDERFAVIPQDIEKHLKPEIAPEQYDYLKAQLANGKPVTMIIELRPLKADMEAPFDMDGTGGGVERKDGKGQWMFLTDIASMSIWNKKGSMLWEYTAPWYVTPMRGTILDLYKDKK